MGQGVAGVGGHRPREEVAGADRIEQAELLEPLGIEARGLGVGGREARRPSPAPLARRPARAAASPRLSPTSAKSSASLAGLGHPGRGLARGPCPAAGGRGGSSGPPDRRSWRRSRGRRRRCRAGCGAGRACRGRGSRSSPSPSSTLARATFSPATIRSLPPAPSSVESISARPVDSHSVPGVPVRFLKPSTATDRRGVTRSVRQGEPLLRLHLAGPPLQEADRAHADGQQDQGGEQPDLEPVPPRRVATARGDGSRRRGAGGRGGRSRLGAGAAPGPPRARARWRSGRPGRAPGSGGWPPPSGRRARARGPAATAGPPAGA